MISLRQILADHAPLLVLDAASARIQVGQFGLSGPARWAVSDEEAGVGLFRGIESLGVDIASVRAFAFADGPGSILGIRTAAMALRTWCVLEARPCYAYNALALLAASLGKMGLTVIADARRGLWHACRLGADPARVPAAELSGPLAMPEGFRHWAPLPAGVEPAPYVLAELLERTAEVPLFRKTEAPDAYSGEEPRYATWTPQVHRAP